MSDRSPRRTGDVPTLVAGARAGDPRSVARLISLVEDASPLLREVAAALAPHAGAAHVLGITGPPGVGKSTTTAALVAAFRSRDRRVGVLAVDPSSPFSGGALLGDRVRMGHLATDPGVFIRSMAARGQLGGLSWATPQAVRVLESAGCDVVLVETVGVGQSELEVASLADTTLVLTAPGTGDGVQAAKAGILEVADVLVVNKADRDGADRTVHQLRAMLSLGTGRTGWTTPVCRTVATREDDAGLADLVLRIDEHRGWLASSGELGRRRARRAAREIEAIALAQLRSRIGDLGGAGALDTLAARVVAGSCDPYGAADELVAQLRDSSARMGP